MMIFAGRAAHAVGPSRPLWFAYNEVVGGPPFPPARRYRQLNHVLSGARRGNEGFESFSDDAAVEEPCRTLDRLRRSSVEDRGTPES